jgi:FMN phosphatase YigB (HAD superfamily)
MDDDDKVALVDMDGTLCDFRGALDRDLARVLNGRGEEVKVPACVKQEIEWLIRRTPGWYLNLKPLQLGFDILRMLQEIGFRINILTKSSFESNNAWSEKPQWIQQHLPRDIEMTVTMNKSRYYGRVLVDDYPSHFLRWMDRRPRGIVVMPVQAWNKDTSRRPNLYPVSSGEDLEKIRPVLEEAFERKGGERGVR